jgi:hypothetical protein
MMSSSIRDSVDTTTQANSGTRFTAHIPGAGTSVSVIVEIGGLAIDIQTTDPVFERILKERYGEYVKSGVAPDFTLRVQVSNLVPGDPAADVKVWLEESEWRMERGDFRASWNPATRQGQVVQTANPYAIDSVLRIVHTLMLAPEGGFLLHASSAVRNGKAFLFSGVSTAGKTTISRLAPSDVALLTDEASYVRKVNGRYVAYGTPFSGELGVPGKNISAPIAALYLLNKAAENRIEKLDPTIAVQRLLRNILFFAHESDLVRQVFEAAYAFVAAVPVFQLSFFPDQRVWELIG